MTTNIELQYNGTTVTPNNNNPLALHPIEGQGLSTDNWHTHENLYLGGDLNQFCKNYKYPKQQASHITDHFNLFKDKK